jgi:hypothetical protein
MLKIPPSLIGTAAPALAQAFTHSGLNSLFPAYGFPGDPPEGNKQDKCLAWLRRANSGMLDPLRAFGALIGEFMDTAWCLRNYLCRSIAYGAPDTKTSESLNPMRILFVGVAEAACSVLAARANVEC